MLWSFLGELQRRLHLRGVGHDLRVQLAALLDQPLLALVRLLQRPVQLLILLAEALQAFVADKLGQDLLEVPLQRVQ